MTDAPREPPTVIPERGSDAYYRLAAEYGWCTCPDGITWDSDWLCAFCSGSEPKTWTVEPSSRRFRGPVEVAAVALTAFVAAAAVTAAVAVTVGHSGRAA